MSIRKKFRFGLFVCLSSVPALLHADEAALLVAPQELSAGGRSAVTVTTFDASSRAAVASPVVITLYRGDELLSTLHTGATGTSGHLRVAFDVPDVPPGSYYIQAQVGGIAEPLRTTTTISRTPAILIETDKPIYKPGQTIRGRVLLIDNALRPASGSVSMAIHDAKGIRIDRRELECGEFGAAEFSLQLADEVNYGVWKIKMRSENVESIRDVRVEKYTLPRFNLLLARDRSWALVDETLQGSIEARYFFGKNVEGTARIVAKRWVGEWQEYATARGELSDGRWQFDLPAVEFVAGTPGESGQGGVTLEYEVIDSTGHRQNASEVVQILQSEMILGLIPRERTLKPDMPFSVLVTARSPEGNGLDSDVRVEANYFGSWGQPIGETQSFVVPVRDGLADVQFHAPDESQYAELSAQAEIAGRRAMASTRLDGAYSSGNSYLSLRRVKAEGAVDVGSSVEFSTLSTHPGTVYFEVYAGGRTVLSGDSESGAFSIAVTPAMAPRSKIVVYKINPNNEVSADSMELPVHLPSAISVVARFDSEQVEPGSEVELTIDSGTGERTLLGVAIVDESVLALGRSRLHMADVFAELERRFLEPRVEIHEGGEPGFGRGGPWSPPNVVGSLDTIEDVGLTIAYSEGIEVPAGFGLWDDVLEDVDAVPGRAEGGDEASDPDAVRVRQYFPETWVWQPMLLSDENGRATLRLRAPDNITNWKLSVMGSSPQGLGFGEGDLTVFQDFFVDPSLPYSATRGEEFPIRVNVFNYLEESQEVNVEFRGTEGLELLGESEASVTVPAQSATSVEFPVRPRDLGPLEIEIIATSSGGADAVRKVLLVEAEGLATESVENRVIQAGTSVSIDATMPPNIVPDSGRSFLHVTPSPVAQTMAGLDDLLSMPYGCGEQNMIFLAPDVEILKYLRETGELATEIRAKAEYYVNVGYQRELTYQTDDGGFAAFGGEEGSLWLTAFVLSTFSCAREIRDIDEVVLSQSAGMLVSRQIESGSFRTDDFLIHKEMDGGLENQYAMTAYVANALADYVSGGTASEDTIGALSRAGGYLAGGWSSVGDDSYSLSIAAVALQKIPGQAAAASAVLDRLTELALDGEAGLHWEPYPVETTGYATMALITADRPQAAPAIEWLSTQRNSLGGYGGSTQDTVVAIRTLFLAARKMTRNLDVDLLLSQSGEEIWSLHIDASNFDVLHTTQLPPSVDGELVLTSSGEGNVGYQVVRKFNVPGEEFPPARDMLIDVDYDSDHIEIDDIVDVRVRLLYSGSKDATGMVIADIGIPTGFDTQRDSVDAIVEAGIASRVEHAGRKVIIYINSLTRDEEVRFSFQIRALYPVRAEGPISQVYEYYDRDVQAYFLSTDIQVISGVAEKEFIRGDANQDQDVDLSDAVLILNHLFIAADARVRRCEDAADTNDDAALNITDAIFLLQHLFLGGAEPSPPYPERGTDPSHDALECTQ